jgi:hypothetical protein
MITVHLSLAEAWALSGALDRVESVNEHLAADQASAGAKLDRALAQAPPPESPTAQLRALMDAHDWDNETQWWTDFRNCVIGITDEVHEMDPAEAERIAALVTAVSLDPRGGAEEITSLALAMALCPLHLRDYASCAEDQDPECAAIRAIHPGSGPGRRATP